MRNMIIYIYMCVVTLCVLLLVSCTSSLDADTGAGDPGAPQSREVRRNIWYNSVAIRSIRVDGTECTVECTVFNYDTRTTWVSRSSIAAFVSHATSMCDGQQSNLWRTWSAGGSPPAFDIEYAALGTAVSTPLSIVVPLSYWRGHPLLSGPRDVHMKTEGVIDYWVEDGKGFHIPTKFEGDVLIVPAASGSKSCR